MSQRNGRPEYRSHPDSAEPLLANRELDAGALQQLNGGKGRRYEPRARQRDSVAGTAEFAAKGVSGAIVRHERRPARQRTNGRAIGNGVRPVTNGPENVYIHQRASYSLTLTG